MINYTLSATYKDELFIAFFISMDEHNQKSTEVHNYTCFQINHYSNWNGYVKDNDWDKRGRINSFNYKVTVCVQPSNTPSTQTNT